MAKAKFFLPENRNNQLDEASAIPTDIFIPANINRTAERTTPGNQGTFLNNIPNNSISLNAFLDAYVADIYPLTGAFDVNASTATIDSTATTTITGGTGAQVIATTGEVDITSTAGTVDINAGTDVTINSTTSTNITAGNLLSLNAATGSANLTAPAGNVALVPGLNLIFILSAIPTYPNDTDAGVGGLTEGMVYKQATGELMIKL